MRVAGLQEGCTGILVLFDADYDCPKELAATLQAWAQEAAGQKACAVVMANREYEAWLLASIETLRGQSTILPDAAAHSDPEAPRDAKGELQLRSKGGRYSPSVDQARLTASLDLGSAYKHCRSFRKLVAAFGKLAAAAGVVPAVWPPAAWRS